MISQPTYCPGCGQRLQSRHVEGRDRHYCQSCDRIVYQNPKPCSGVLVLDGDEVLLVKRTEPPAVGSWSLPAGYLEVDEPPEQAAVRELREETGLEAASDALTLVDTVFVSHSDNLNVLVVVYAVARSRTSGDPVAGSDAAAARFWNRDELVNHNTERFEPGYLESVGRAQELLAER